MTTIEILEELSAKAVKDKTLREKLYATRSLESPLRAFSGVAAEYGYAISPMDIVEAGEEFHAAMKRSTNGGGENSPMLTSQDDFYAQFFVMLEIAEGKEK